MASDCSRLSNKPSWPGSSWARTRYAMEHRGRTLSPVSTCVWHRHPPGTGQDPITADSLQRYHSGRLAKFRKSPCKSRLKEQASEHDGLAARRDEPEATH